MTTPSLSEVMQELSARGSPSIKKTHMRHGAPEPLFGVKVGDLKPLLIATAGWATLSSVAAVQPDKELPISEFGASLDRCVKSIGTSPNRVRSAMNSFIISVGTYIAPLANQAISTARKIGIVEVDAGNTDSKIPDAESYIKKCRRGADVAPKRKTTLC